MSVAKPHKASVGGWVTVMWARFANPLRPNQSPQDINYYINFVLYAVLGKMSEADGLMRQYGDGIRRIAASLRARRRFPQRRLYRGMLLDPAHAAEGVLLPDPDRTFLSWSEKIDVACWFADKQSIMSKFIRMHFPRAQGFIASVKQPPAPMLFHYTWAENFEISGRRVDLAKLALMHPEMGREGYDQIRWALSTQHEVITETVWEPLPIKPVEDFNCPDTEELDAKLAWTRS